MQEEIYQPPTKNTGVVIEIMPGAYDITDPRREYQRHVLVEDGDLRPYRPIDERQSSSKPKAGQINDSMSCVSQSNGSSVETNTTTLLRNDKLPLATEKFLRKNEYVDSKDTVNYDERMLATESGTTPLGNSLDRVAETGRKIGYAPGRAYDWDHFTWEDYYKPTDPRQLELGREWLTHFDVWHYWLITGSNAGADTILPVLAQNMQYGAIQLATTTHAFLALWSDGKSKLAIEETYAPYFRDNQTYSFSMIWAKLIVVTVKGQLPIPYLPYFEKKIGQSTIAAYHKPSDTMRPYASGEVFQTVSGEYAKARKVTEWARPLDTTKIIDFTNLK